MPVIDGRFKEFSGPDPVLEVADVHRLEDDDALVADQLAEGRRMLHYPHVKTADNKFPVATGADTVTLTAGTVFQVGGVVFALAADQSFTIPDDATRFLRAEVGDDCGQVVDPNADPIERRLTMTLSLVSGSESDDEGTGGGPSSPDSMRVLKAVKGAGGSTPAVTAYANDGHSHVVPEGVADHLTANPAHGDVLHTDTGGSANVYVITPSPAMAAYAAGQAFAVKIRTGGNNTGACTLNVNGLGAKSIKLAGGGDPGADQIVAGAVMRVQYDGTQFRLLNPNLQKMANVTRYATAGTFTYTVPDGVHWLDVEVWGAGGGGAWADGITGYAAGGGGGYARKLCAVTPGQQVTVTVGAGGNGGSSGSGSDGGSSSFGAFCSATGGKGGVSQGGNQSTNGGDGGSGSGGDINLTGGKGMGNAQSAGGDAPLGGAGGVFSYNGTTFSSGPGQAPGGGGSSIQYSSGAGRPGGAGGAGEVRIRY